jgi:polar amino acid transport system ATP-binding protein
MATHEIGFARKVADRVVFLQGGAIVEQGPPEQVLGDPTQPETQEFLRRVMI